MAGVLKYFAFQGRDNRKRYWMTVLALVGLFFLGALLGSMLMILSPIAGLLIIPLALMFYVAAFALGSRRLHDRNKSAWWLIPMQGMPLALTLLAQLIKMTPGGEAPAALLALLSLPFSIWAFVELGCLKGTTGPNRFGDDPVEPRPIEVFA